MTRSASPDKPIRLRSSRDVVAAVPHLLGYRPRRSIVFLNTHSAGRMSTVRVGLPETGPVREQRKLITSLVGMLCRVPEVHRMLIVVYADGPFDSGGDVAGASFIRPLIGRLLDSGFAVHDALCVADDAWGAYDGHDAGIPHRLDELDEPPLGVGGTAAPADGVDGLARLPATGYMSRRAFELSLDRVLRDTVGVRPIVEAEAVLALDESTASTDELAAILHVLLHPELRDAVLFTWAWGAERGLELLDEAERIERGDIGPDDDTIALDLMGFGHAGPPDRARIARAIALMARVAALAPDDVAHIPLTVLAWLHWSQGRGSVAGLFVDRARELDPSYGLAELLQSVLQQGLLPGWAFALPGE